MTKNIKLALALVGILAGLGWWQRRAIQNMTIGVNNETLALANVQAFLKTIRVGEGTGDPLGYQRLVGSKSGAQFTSFADHPRIKVPLVINKKMPDGTISKISIMGTAAGAYQFLESTWDTVQSSYDLPDFSPHSQDLAAVALIKRRGALLDVVEGKFSDAVDKVNKEWASLPGSPYGQRTVLLADAQANYIKYGGKVAVA